jgi:diacylglycerol O-acyltransferase-1
VPLVSLTEMLRKLLKSDTLGNMIFWTSFCLLGQPMCLILYYHDYVLAHMGVQGLAKAAAAGAGAAASAAVGSLAGEGVGGALAATAAAAH